MANGGTQVRPARADVTSWILRCGVLPLLLLLLSLLRRRLLKLHWLTFRLLCRLLLRLLLSLWLLRGGLSSCLVCLVPLCGSLLWLLLLLLSILLRCLAAAALRNDGGSSGGGVLGTGYCRLRALGRCSARALALSSGLATRSGGAGGRAQSRLRGCGNLTGSGSSRGCAHDEVGAKNLQKQAWRGSTAQ